MLSFIGNVAGLLKGAISAVMQLIQRRDIRKARDAENLEGQIDEIRKTDKARRKLIDPDDRKRLRDKFTRNDE